MINIKNIFSFSLLAVAFVSCEKVEDYEDVRTGKSYVTVNSTSASVVEGTPVTFTLTVDKPLPVKMDYKLELSDAGSTASFRDFTTSGTETSIDESGFGQGKIGYRIEFPAGAKTYSFTITPNVDLLKEGTETLNVRLSSSGNGRGLVAPGSDILSIKIADFTSNDVGVQLLWGKQTDRFGTITDKTFIGRDNASHDTSIFDFDLYLLDSTGTPLNNDGATGANPELTTLLSTDPDGVYDVYFELYVPAGAPGVTFNNSRPKVAFPLMVDATISKYGIFASSFKVPMSTDDTFAGNVAKITKTGTTYVVKNLAGVTIASGKLVGGSVKPNFKRLR